MKKVLFIGDGGQFTGFSTVMHNIIGNMDHTEYDVYHLAVNHTGDPTEHPWKMYPAALGGDYLGYNRIKDFSKLDLKGIFILNDPWVIHDYLVVLKEAYKDRTMPPIVVYFPVDSMELDAEWFSNFDIVNKVCVYTEFGKRETLKAINRPDIEIIFHGIDTKSFYKMTEPKEIIKARVYPNNPEFIDSFVVLNANRNQPRKRIDLTLEAFKLFSDDKPENVKLYLHMGIKDIGYNVAKLAIKLGIDSRLCLSNDIKKIQQVSLAELNLIYNATDCGINTCVGEGWSLTNMEHAVTGAIQVVPDHSALTELYDDCGILYPVDRYIRNMEVLTLAGLVRPEVAAAGLQYAYDHRSENLGEAGLKKFTSPEYNWENIVKEKWLPIFEEYFV
jgi:glycosyltransferase involved in cell wall biosynthesis